MIGRVQKGTNVHLCTLYPMGAKKRRIGYKKVHTPYRECTLVPLRASDFILDSGTEVRALTSVPGLELDR